MPNFLTPEGQLKIQQEIKELEEKRPEIAGRIRAAQEFGDVSENTELTTAKDDQYWTEGEIKRLRDLLISAEIVDSHHKSDIVEISSTVKLKIGQETKTYTIVGSEESDPSLGRVSHQSPMGEALLDKKLNEKVTIKTPQGKIQAEIIGIE